MPGGSYGSGSIVSGLAHNGIMDDTGALVYIWDNGAPSEWEDVAIYAVMDCLGRRIRGVRGRHAPKPDKA